MAKYSNPTGLDQALNWFAGSTRMTICSAQPANFAGIAAVSLGSYTMSGANFTGPANGAGTGRKITVGARTGNNATGTGSVNHIALDDGSTLRYVTTTPAKSVTSGEPFDVGAWEIEISGPT
jgi:hypothetical protein